MNIRYRVTLTSDERQQLQALCVLVSGGKAAAAAARKIKRAQILLAADAKSTDDAIALNIGVVRRPCTGRSSSRALKKAWRVLSRA